MIKGYAEEIEKIYSKIREKEAFELKKRKEEIALKLPEVINIDNKIGKLFIQLSVSMFKDLKVDRNTYIKNLKDEITDLRIKKSEILSSHGYPIDYLNIKYRCPKCKDTGYIETKKCSCYKKYLVKLYYKDSELNSLLSINNFDNFDINFYSTRKTQNELESPRKNIEKIFTRALNFVNTFDTSKENLLFYGNSGTGKTFLCQCIAKDLLDKGHLVIYKTSDDLLNILKKIRFENNSELEDLIVNCDLLIIDDLGTEQINDFSKTEVFNLINRKLLSGKKMVISSNHTLEGLSRIYSERITSRLFGDFTLCKFYGDDIRVKKNLNRMKE
ncbi:DNA replication protein DnaC [Clostridium sp. DMHC 10]|uniref:ATP-binding protein n=1 Tax=Clostridium sp. DMHC 10 TaxID=747377 RepID=UPI00069ECA0B|nr:ATP-binding protein [Clostridium sp. DMHC 10]KOF55704.1 DNA replication protein DnaC [Clostridium sp. DMHC 10]